MSLYLLSDYCVAEFKRGTKWYNKPLFYLPGERALRRNIGKALFKSRRKNVVRNANIAVGKASKAVNQAVDATQEAQKTIKKVKSLLPTRKQALIGLGALGVVGVGGKIGLDALERRNRRREAQRIAAEIQLQGKSRR